MARNGLIAGLDIGTTKVCCVVAELGETGDLMVTGVGVSRSCGLKRGIVVDIDATVRAIEEAVAKAARQTGRDIPSVYVGVTGEHIASLNSKGAIAITHPNREIDEDDVDRVVDDSRVIVIPPDRTILHAIPRSYSVDGQNGIRHPVGMSGTRLEVETHIVTGGQSFLENIKKCVNRAGLGLDDMVLEPLASGDAVAMPAEKNLGVCAVDIGGGTTDLAVFHEGEIYYSAVIPVGGNHVTNDLAQLLRVSVEDAERIKIEYGSAVAGHIGENETFPLTQIGWTEPKPLRRRALCEIIEARMQELFQLLQKEITTSGCQNMLAAGMVVSGGGSLLRGTAECAGEVLGIPVRLGKPKLSGGLSDSVNSPVFATAVGLIRFGAGLQRHQRRQSQANGPFGGLMKTLSGVFGRLRTD